MFLKILQFSQDTPVFGSLFIKIVGLQACKFIKKRFQYRCFTVKFARFLYVPILKNIRKRMLLAGMVLLTNFNSTFDNSIKDGISLAFLRVGDFAQGAPRKDLINAPFVKRFKAPTL